MKFSNLSQHISFVYFTHQEMSVPNRDLINAIDLYVGPSHYIINNSMRVGRLSLTVYITILRIILYILRHKSTGNLENYNYTVYRGVRHHSYNNLSVGDEFEDPAFNSFTLDLSVASAISETVLKVNLPRQIDYVYFEADDEILTLPGFKYTVKNVYYNKNTKIYKVDAVPTYSLGKLKASLDSTLSSAQDHIIDLSYRKYIGNELGLED